MMTMRASGPALAAVVLCAAVAAAGQSAGGRPAPVFPAAAAVPYPPVGAAELADPPPADWPMYRRTYDGWGWSPLGLIHPGNAADLAPAWEAAPGVGGERAQAPPIVRTGRMFVSGPEGVASFDARTGGLLWRRPLPPPAGLFGRPHDVNRGVALWGGAVYAATLGAGVAALSAADGRVLWESILADHAAGYYSTLAPLAAEGLILTGVSGGEYGVRGFIAALDASTGDEVWRFHTVPAPGEPGSETWTREAWRTGGGPVWSTGVYDPDRGATYWGVGNGGPWTRDARPGDNLFTNSTVALDVQTGALLGWHQYHHNGSWDWDESVPPLLIDFLRGGRRVRGAVHPGRNGYLWFLERGLDGGLSFVDALPFVYQDVFADVDPFTGRPSYRPGAGAADRGRGGLLPVDARRAELAARGIRPGRAAAVRACDHGPLLKDGGRPGGPPTRAAIQGGGVEQLPARRLLRAPRPAAGPGTSTPLRPCGRGRFAAPKPGRC